MAKDMTQGNLVRALVSFSIPLIFSGLLQQLYSWADAFIVGNIEGELALAAIGAMTIMSNLIVMLITGFTSGISILAARTFGRGENQRLKKVLSTFLAVLGSVFLVAGIAIHFSASSILHLLHTPEDIYLIAKGYLQTIAIGIPFLAIYNVYSAVLRGVGDSRAPFLAVAISSAANVLLDLLFVGEFRMGAWGAAVATVLSQILMTVFICCYILRRYAVLRFRFGREMIDFGVLKEGSALGLPATVQSGVSSAGNVVLQNFMNGFGTRTVAAITTAYRVDSIILLPVINLGTGISTVVAQNRGAGNDRRAKKGFYAGAALMAGVSVCLTIFVILVGGPLIAMFGVTPEALEIGIHFFHSFAKFYPVYGMAMALRGFLEGTGDVLYASVGGMLAFGIRILLSNLLKPYFGNMVIAYAEGLSWCAMFALYLLRFLPGQLGKGDSDLRNCKTREPASYGTKNGEGI